MFLFASLLPSLMFAAGALLAIVILLKRSYRFFGRGGSGAHITHVARPDKMRNPIDEARGSRDFDRFEIRMQELMREHTARLDSKMLALQVLLRDADETLAKLAAAVEQSNNRDD